MAEVVAAFILGAVAGALVSWAWRVDQTQDAEPTEHGRKPL